jgi:hypothetical protein
VDTEQALWIGDVSRKPLHFAFLEDDSMLVSVSNGGIEFRTTGKGDLAYMKEWEDHYCHGHCMVSTEKLDGEGVFMSGDGCSIRIEDFTWSKRNAPSYGTCHPFTPTHPASPLLLNFDV